jgi:hypothetical protein
MYWLEVNQIPEHTCGGILVSMARGVTSASDVDEPDVIV